MTDEQENLQTAIATLLRAKQEATISQLHGAILQEVNRTLFNGIDGALADLEPLRAALSDKSLVAGEKENAEILSSGRMIGKSTFLSEAFINDINAGKESIYIAEKYVVMSTSHYDRLVKSSRAPSELVAEQMPSECIWTLSDDPDDDYYSTSCGREFCLIDGTPQENEYHYCPNCGGKLIVRSRLSDTSIPSH